MNLRTFTIGIIVGILLTLGSFVAVSEITGVKFQPVSSNDGAAK